MWAREIAAVAALVLGAVGAPVAPEAAPATVRVMTWNVHGSADPPLGSVARLILSEGVDVAALQEVEEDQAREVEGLLRAHDGRWRSAWHPTGHDPLGPLPFTPPPEGHAILSRFPLSEARAWTLPQRDFHPRIVQRAVVAAGPTDVYVYNTHLCRTPELDSVDRSCWARDQAGRTAQAEAVLRHVRDDGAAVWVLAGDMNARPGSRPIDVLRHAGRDAWIESRSVRRRARIDYVFVRGVAVTSAKTPRSGVSDHLPVVAELRLDDDGR
jgi:endonuclease/exonuclease/phosphatase family metal-dependent hydrolase